MRKWQVGTILLSSLTFNKAILWPYTIIITILTKCTKHNIFRVEFFVTCVSVTKKFCLNRFDFYLKKKYKSSTQRVKNIKLNITLYLG